MPVCSTEDPRFKPRESLISTCRSVPDTARHRRISRPLLLVKQSATLRSASGTVRGHSTPPHPLPLLPPSRTQCRGAHRACCPPRGPCTSLSRHAAACPRPAVDIHDDTLGRVVGRCPPIGRPRVLPQRVRGARAPRRDRTSARTSCRSNAISAASSTAGFASLGDVLARCF